jgi:FkbM family methyltransferase
MYLHVHDEVLTPAISAHRGMADDDLGLLRELGVPGATVVDVGANVGYAALAAAQVVGPAGSVMAIEPHPLNVQLLRANLRRNGAAHVTVVDAAAWDVAGEVLLAECRTNTGDHRVGTHIPGRSELRVRAVRLDDVVPADADVRLIKLDTQATEHIALRGAAELVARCRPVMLVEFWPQGIRERGDDPLAVLAQYREMGYGWTVVEDGSMDGLGDADLVDRVHARPAPYGGFVTLRLDPSA